MEREHHGLERSLARFPNGRGDHRLVAAMHAVEVADRDQGRARCRAELLRTVHASRLHGEALLLLHDEQQGSLLLRPAARTSCSMTPDAALGEAGQGELRPVYLVLGDDPFARADVVQALRAAATAGGVAGLNDDQYVAGEAAVDAVLSAAKTLPMMARRRYVSVRALERWEPRESAKADEKAETKARAAEPLEQLASYAERPCESTTLVLVAEKLDKRRRLVALGYKSGFIVECIA